MADRLSQLQTCLDQLVTQFFSSLNYINKHHDFEPVHGEAKVSDPQLESVSSDKFSEDLTELSKDIVLKAQQIEILIDSLPGLDTSEQDQLETIGKLNEELRQVRSEKDDVLVDRKKLLEQCNELIMKITRQKVELEQASEQSDL